MWNKARNSLARAPTHFTVTGNGVSGLSKRLSTLPLSELTAVTSVDGRYGRHSKELRNVFSEYALIRNRVIVEAEWLKQLAKATELPEVSTMSAEAEHFLDDIVSNFSVEDAGRVKEIERTTNHDIKAVEYFLKEKISLHKELSQSAEFVHFACTSEDINNLAYALMLKDARTEIMLPSMDKVISEVSDLAEKLSTTPMLARTHGQPATPTTVGKELANFAYRMGRQRKQYEQCEILGKMNGAVGNYAAHQITVRELDWPGMTKKFIENGLGGIKWNPYTTQIEPHDFVAETCDVVCRFNNVLLDMDRDMWSYISLGYFKQKVIEGEIGSSTMPHKVNPIDFENSEGNIGLANSTLSHLAMKLPISRFQRDLSDSTVMRTLGTGFAYSKIAHNASIRGLSRIDSNEERLLEDLDKNWEVLAEPVQTVMRRYGKEAPYEALKELTRGKKVDGVAMREYISSLDLPQEDKNILLELEPKTYIGNSAEMAKKEVIQKWLKID
mmetsp:Transcript_14770/g.19378  ORF Transcript_14770/g.19378 Transcript_14770/m.19378 type:complete len:499 (-) Transcript_14770:191-1687(-)